MNHIAERRPSVSPAVSNLVATGVDLQSPMTADAQQKGTFRAAWQQLIDNTLTRWLQDPSQLEDRGLEPPTGTVLRLALDYAEKFRDDGLAPPDSIVPDPNAGIVLERQRHEFSEVFHFWDDGTLEYQRFHRANLVERIVL